MTTRNVHLVNGEDFMERWAGHIRFMRPFLAANANPISANATLREDEWQMIDERVNGVLRSRLTIMDDLRSRGLVEPISVGTVIRKTERLEDFEDAELSYDAETAPQKDRPSYLTESIPVPVIHKDFSINFRQLDASRTRGELLDTTSAELATRKVRDRVQALFTNGIATGGPTGGGIPGLTTATNRLQVTLNNNWDAAADTPVADVERMLAAAYNVNLFGPFILYVPKNYWATVQEDYETSGGAVINRTVTQRILDFTDIEELRPLDALADDNVVMVQMTREIIDASEAMPVTTVQWEKNPWVTNFRVMMIGGPQIKSIEDEDGTTRNGIVHLKA